MSVCEYTWGFKYPPSRVEFERASEACQHFCTESGIIANLSGWDGCGNPQFGPGIVCFNGSKNKLAQTFKIRIDGTGLKSCNTESKSYDLAVRCCLLIFEQLVNGFYFRGGGNNKDWKEANDLVSRFWVSQQV